MICFCSHKPNCSYNKYFDDSNRRNSTKKWIAMKTDRLLFLPMKEIGKNKIIFSSKQKQKNVSGELIKRYIKSDCMIQYC